MAISSGQWSWEGDRADPAGAAAGWAQRGQTARSRPRSSHQGAAIGSRAAAGTEWGPPMDPLQSGVRGTLAGRAVQGACGGQWPGGYGAPSWGCPRRGWKSARSTASITPKLFSNLQDSVSSKQHLFLPTRAAMMDCQGRSSLLLTSRCLEAKVRLSRRKTWPRCPQLAGLPAWGRERGGGCRPCFAPRRAAAGHGSVQSLPKLVWSLPAGLVGTG